MFTRGLVLCLMLAVASVAQAGAVIDLVSSAPTIPSGGSVTVSVYITQDADPALAPMLPRMVQLDTSASTSGLAFSAPGTSGTIVEMWDFETASDCPGSCGTAHVIDAAFPVVSAAYGDATHLGPDATVQMNLPDTIQTKIGEIVVECGTADAGPVTINVLNAADQGADAGARLFFGFGANVDGTPITTWTAAAGDITGGSIVLTAECTEDPNLIAALPVCDGSLWRIQDNFVELTFDGDVTGSAAPAIRELLAGGTFGPDISGQFTFSNPSSDVLRIDENGDSDLAHGTWYGIIGGNYQVNYQVAIGDVTGDGRVISLDVSNINGGIPCFACPDDRRDINGDGRIISIDVSITNGFIPYFGTAQPTGHTCIP